MVKKKKSIVQLIKETNFYEPEVLTGYQVLSLRKCSLDKKTSKNLCKMKYIKY